MKKNYIIKTLVIACLILFSGKVFSQENVIKNGTFDTNTSGWYFDNNADPATTTGTIVDGELVVEITGGPAADYQASFSNNYFEIKAGTYELTFDAYSDIEASAWINLAKSYDSPFDYASLDNTWKTIGTTKQNYSITFTITTEETSARIAFGVGKFGTFTIDNVVLKRTSKNILVNGGFDQGFTGWTFVNENPELATNDSTIVDGELVCNVTRTGSVWNYQVAVQQAWFKLDAGSYQLTFDASGSPSQKNYVKINNSTPVVIGAIQKYDITDTTTSYTYKFDVDSDMEEVRVLFGFGMFDQFKLDNVSLSLCSDDTTIIEASICEGDNFMGFTETGTYLVDDAEYGCSGAKVILNVEDAPELSLRNDVVITANDSVVLDAGLHSSYLWSTGDTIQKITIQGSDLLADSIIWVEVASDAGCSVSDTVVVSLLKSYKVKFTVLNDSDAAVEGAEVLFINETLTTDISGIVEFAAVTPTTNEVYKVTKDGYNDYEGTVSIVDQDVNVSVKLIAIPKTYTVTFNVVDKNNDAIEGAEVFFVEETLTTNNSGSVVFSAVSPTTNAAYKITKIGYEANVGTISVVDKDVSVDITMLKEVGINESLVVNSLYPNPSSGIINIQLSSATNIATFELHDINGILIEKQTLTSLETTIDVSNNKPGVYFVRVVAENNQFTSKLILK